MIRVIYRWKIKPGDAVEFKAAWDRATTKIRDTITGARGSVLLQSHHDATEYLTIARWDKIEDWKDFWKDSSTKEMQGMHDVAERLSVDVFEELEDHTV